MPFKFHESRRRHIPKARHRVRNWAVYDLGLVRRGDVRVWLSDDAIAGWRAACRTNPGGQRRFSNLAIETTLMLGAVMRLPLRQTEGFVCLLLEIMRTSLPVLDHTTLARRRRTVDVHDDRSVLYHRVPRLFEALGLARGDGRHARLLKSIARTQLLVLDDWGLANLTPDQGRDLLEIIDDRQGRGSTIVTSQLPVGALA
jgi:hypothetical protein